MSHFLFWEENICKGFSTFTFIGKWIKTSREFEHNLFGIPVETAFSFSIESLKEKLNQFLLIRTKNRQSKSWRLLTANYSDRIVKTTIYVSRRIFWEEIWLKKNHEKLSFRDLKPKTSKRLVQSAWKLSGNHFWWYKFLLKLWKLVRFWEKNLGKVVWVLFTSREKHFGPNWVTEKFVI